jgi:hypothetical protein
LLSTTTQGFISFSVSVAAADTALILGAYNLFIFVASYIQKRVDRKCKSQVETFKLTTKVVDSGDSEIDRLSYLGGSDSTEMGQSVQCEGDRGTVEDSPGQQGDDQLVASGSAELPSGVGNIKGAVPPFVIINGFTHIPSVLPALCRRYFQQVMSPKMLQSTHLKSNHS